jgi:uncharacterized protein YbjT (DUF2867 family)
VDNTEEEGLEMRIAVAGGTGLIGKMVVHAAREHGHTPVVIARSTGVDLSTGAGLDDALRRAEALIDVTNVTTTKRATSIAFFETATTTLLRAAAQAGVGHHVALSIVGCDRVHLGYYAGKVRQENLVLAGAAGGGVPATVLRATQFHEFAAQMLANAPGPLLPVPIMLSRPIAAREVAEALVEIAVGPPQGLAPDLAGPEEKQLVAMTRQVVKARRLRRLVVPIPVPGEVGKALRHGGLLPTGPGPRGTQTFEQWLAEQGRLAS